MADFGAKLRELRAAAGLTREQLGARAQLHPMTLAKYENGQREPTWAAVAALCDALDVSCDAFREPVSGEVAKQGPGRPPNKPPTAPAEEAASTPPAGTSRKKASAGQAVPKKPARRKGKE